MERETRPLTEKRRSLRARMTAANRRLNVALARLPEVLTSQELSDWKFTKRNSREMTR